VHRLIFFFNEVRQRYLGFSHKIIGGNGGIVEDCEPHLFGVPQQVCGEGLIPSGFVSLALGGCPLYGDIVHYYRHVRIHCHSHVVPCHEVGVLEALGLDHGDLQPAVEHLDAEVPLDDQKVALTIKASLVEVCDFTKKCITEVVLQ